MQRISHVYSKSLCAVLVRHGSPSGSVRSPNIERKTLLKTLQQLHSETTVTYVTLQEKDLIFLSCVISVES